MLGRWRRAALLVLSVLALAGCSLQQDIASEPPTASVAPTQAPVIQGTFLEGTRFSWASLHAHPVVLDFWASWCSPCRAEQGAVNALYRQYAGRGVVFVGIDMRDDNASADAYRSDFSVPYQSVADASEQISAAYNVVAPPTIVVINQQGYIVGRFLGTTSGVGAQLDSLLR